MNTNMNTKEKREAGFTLLELLIVVSIIAILSVALVVVLDPAETLRKSRDAQRISDMTSMKTALGLYLTSTTTPYLGAATAGALNNTNCVANTGTAISKIMYSLPSATSLAGDTTLDGVATAVQVATPALVDGAGWIPVMFENLTGGSPISNLPVDPINTVATPATVANTDLVYRYACSISPLSFEINAQLESTAYKTTEDKRASDGGNSANYYEIGTNLKIMGRGATDF